MKNKLSNITIKNTEPDLSKRIYLTDTAVTGLRIVIYQTGKKVFQYRFKRLGKSYLVNIGTYGEALTLEMARREAKKLSGQVASGNNPAEAIKNARSKAKSILSVDKLIEVYLEAGPASKPNKRASSWNLDKICLKRHVSPVLGKIRLDELNRQRIAKWQIDVKDGKTKTEIKTKARGLARVSGGIGAAGRSFTALSTMLNWAIEHGYISSNPCKGISALTPEPRNRYFSNHESRAFMEAIEKLKSDKKFRPQAILLEILARTGARLSEIKNLTWNDINLDNNTISVPPLRNKIGSKQKFKVISIDDNCRKLIMSLKNETDWVFPNSLKSAPIEKPKAIIKKVRNLTGIVDFKPHLLRHSYASFAISDRIPLEYIGKALGHTKNSTTQRYAHLQTEVALQVSASVSKNYELSLEEK